ncbi:hypothetical protein [uncultured Clostridium sp.]|uniref:hypothetical protein n=1 Tax=uncultured Clostridium sp. TaxID=59620 RepID=UPI003216BFAB
MRKSILFTILVLLSLSLFGCQNNKEVNQQTEVSESSRYHDELEKFTKNEEDQVINDYIEYFKEEYPDAKITAQQVQQLMELEKQYSQLLDELNNKQIEYGIIYTPDQEDDVNKTTKEITTSQKSELNSLLDKSYDLRIQMLNMEHDLGLIDDESWKEDVYSTEQLREIKY